MQAAPTFGETVSFKAAGSRDNWRWEPEVRRVAKGTTVVWRNPTGKTHTVTAYSSNWDMNQAVTSGDSVRKRFRKSGTYKFRCTVKGHSSLASGTCYGMCGKVRVR